MRVVGVSMRAGRLSLAALVAVVVAGLFGTSVVSAGEPPPECFVAESSLGQARTSYAQTCSLPRIDCDPIDGLWYCSSRVIGSAAPGGVTADDVGGSDIGEGTLVVTVTTTAAPTTAGPTTMAPTTTAAPVTVAPTTVAPTTAVPTTTAAPTTAAPTTAAPTTVAPTTTAAPTTISPSTTSGGGVVGSDVVRRTYTRTDGPERNPMKGWNSGWWDDRDETTVGFQYIKWQDLEPRNGVYDFGAVEDLIDRSGSRNRHVILRLYCDWWGATETSRGCPDWIYSEVGVKRIRGDNGRYITDYNNPRYVDEAVQAIQALAARYDDDPRIYAFQLGVLGYWGEWHTWGSSVGGSSYDISDGTKTRVLDAYTEAFDRVQLMGRYPNRPILATADDIGFHNDYFRPNNGHSAEFDAAVFAGRKWLAGPIGGEVPPGLGSDDFRRMYATSEGREMIETGHYSTMKPTSVDAQYLGQHLNLHKRFGYNYQIDEARFPQTHGRSGRLPAEVTVKNIGIAPFYYDWQVQFGLLGDDGAAVAVVEAESYDLRTHLPGDLFTLEGQVPMVGVAGGRYRLAVRIVQPGADQVKPAPWKLDARHTYILFANDMPVIDGAWNGRNQLEGGWSVLGEVATR